MITKKLKYVITFQFQILSRNILLINMQEIVRGDWQILGCPCLVIVLPNNPNNKMPNPYLQNSKNPIFNQQSRKINRREIVV